MQKRRIVFHSAFAMIFTFLIVLNICLFIVLKKDFHILKEDIRTKEILTYSETGMGDLYYDAYFEMIEEMYVDSASDPYQWGSFFDYKVAAELIEILNEGIFQKCADINLNGAQGSGVWPCFVFKSEHHTYYIAVVSAGTGTIELSIDGNTQFYNTNIAGKVLDLIKQVLNENFG